MSIEEIIKELEHTIEYFEGCADKFQRGRKCQAMVTLEQLRQYNVSGQSEQLLKKVVYHDNVTHLLTILDQMIKEENEAIGKAGFYHGRETHADNKYCLAIVKSLIERRFRNSG